MRTVLQSISTSGMRIIGGGPRAINNRVAEQNPDFYLGGYWYHYDNAFRISPGTDGPISTGPGSRDAELISHLRLPESNSAVANRFRTSWRRP
jgi:hypothetical protein